MAREVGDVVGNDRADPERRPVLRRQRAGQRGDPHEECCAAQTVLRDEPRPGFE